MASILFRLDSEIKYVYINDYCNSLTLELNKTFQTDTTKSKITVNGTAYTIKAIQVTSSSLVLTTDTNTTLTYSKSSYVNISGSIGIMPQNAKVEATDIFPKLNNAYNLGSSVKKWSNLYTGTANTSAINNSGTIKSSYITPNSSNSGYVGSTGNYFSYGAMNTLYANYLKTISGGYHLYSSPSSETSTTWYVHNSNATSETASRQTGGTIYWTGLIINSYPMKFAVLTGNGVRTKNGTPNLVDKILQFMLPTSICTFKSASHNYGYGYQAYVSTLYPSTAQGNMYYFGTLPVGYSSDSTSPSWMNKTTKYFCVSGDVIHNNCTGFQILVLGFIQ